MEMYQDGVEIFCLPDTAKCVADHELRSPLDVPICPIGNMECSGDCEYYSE